MLTKEFTKFQIASFKRVAQNVAPLVRKKEKLIAEMQSIKEELDSLQEQIDAYQGPVKAATGGYTTEDIIYRDVTTTVDKNGNTVKVTAYKLRYPDTVIPTMVESTPVCNTTPEITTEAPLNTVDPIVTDNDFNRIF